MLQNNNKKENVSPVLPTGKKNYLIDIDGTICDDIPNEELERMVTAAEYPGAKDRINRWFDEGHIITFFTSRATREHREITENWLKVHGFKYHTLLMDKPRGGNYYWVDNHLVEGILYKGDWGEI